MNSHAVAPMDHRELKARLTAIKDMPTVPTVLNEVAKMVKSPDASIEEIGRLISMDQVLSAKVLKMVNSPIYGFPGRIGSINHALVLLGFNVLRGIVVSTSVLDIMVQSMNRLWRHSVACALAAGALAREAKLDNPEEYSVAGLLHDMGKLVIHVQTPDLSQKIDELQLAKDLQRLDAEHEVLGFGHDRVNSWLSELWNLPASLEEALAMHHAPEKARNYPEIASVVHVADFVAHAVECDYEHGYVPELKPQALHCLKLDIGCLPLLYHQVLAELPKDCGLPL